ncbi:hypothetical protein FRC17_010365 [Serendipita sp. 399]|nr:hypothetical protein FRC17_010365 [Serendipita sp. 399]
MSRSAADYNDAELNELLMGKRDWSEEEDGPATKRIRRGSPGSGSRSIARSTHTRHASKSSAASALPPTTATMDTDEETEEEEEEEWGEHRLTPREGRPTTVAPLTKRSASKRDPSQGPITGTILKLPCTACKERGLICHRVKDEGRCQPCIDKKFAGGCSFAKKNFAGSELSKQDAGLKARVVEGIRACRESKVTAAAKAEAAEAEEVAQQIAPSTLASSPRRPHRILDSDDEPKKAVVEAIQGHLQGLEAGSVGVREDLDGLDDRVGQVEDSIKRLEGTLNAVSKQLAVLNQITASVAEVNKELGATKELVRNVAFAVVQRFPAPSKSSS